MNSYKEGDFVCKYREDFIRASSCDDFCDQSCNLYYTNNDADLLMGACPTHNSVHVIDEDKLATSEWQRSLSWGLLWSRQ